MKKIIFLAFITISIVLVGCGDDFLNQRNLFEKDLDNYYRNSSEVDEALVGAYSCLALDEGINHPILIANLKGDECFAGGGVADVEGNAIDQFINPKEDIFLPIYNRCYQGIFRINTLLAHIDKTVYDNIDLQKQQLGEAHFLRAFFYFRLAQIFGEVPLDLKPELDYPEKSTLPEIYGQIAFDMQEAINNLPNVAYTASPSGRATKWAAEALMARIYLFYTGIQNTTTLPVAGGSDITKQMVIDWLSDLTLHSGHDLLTNFKSIWPYSCLTASEYSFSSGDWAGDGCKETIFAVKYTNKGHWAAAGNDGRLAYCNEFVLYTSVRGNQYPPFGAGWGIANVNSQLLNIYDLTDIRKQATIIDQSVDIPGYTWNLDVNNHETGLYNKKYNAIVRKNGAGVYQGMYYILYGGNQASNQLWNMQDDIIVRYADVLLMQSELTETATGINAVRNRVGLAPVAYSLQAVKDERHKELALEGIRYYDLLRWGDAVTAINSANGIVDVKNAGVAAKYSTNFTLAKEYSPIPESQIRVSQGKLVQNPAWQ
jgi:starch-binding outer membrane protein, SusD/RagB family